MQREHDAGRGRDALAALESMENRVQMADEHRERGGGNGPRRRAG
jgi:hypothetical protein